MSWQRRFGRVALHIQAQPSVEGNRTWNPASPPLISFRLRITVRARIPGWPGLLTFGRAWLFSTPLLKTRLSRLQSHLFLLRQRFRWRRRGEGSFDRGDAVFNQALRIFAPEVRPLAEQLVGCQPQRTLNYALHPSITLPFPILVIGERGVQIGLRQAQRLLLVFNAQPIAGKLVKLLLSVDQLSDPSHEIKWGGLAAGQHPKHSGGKVSEPTLRSLPCSLDLPIGASVGVFTDHLQCWWFAIAVVISHRTSPGKSLRRLEEAQDQLLAYCCSDDAGLSFFREANGSIKKIACLPGAYPG